MCGIAGFSGSFDPTLLHAMNRIQTHRGPDDAGIWHDADCGIGLAHRRLSILDLSPAGHQPMWDSTRRAVICFNGEIYNFRHLRAEMECDGIGFHSATDTEVVLNLYLRDGPGMLAQLNGMFAFAIWDAVRQELFIARDGIGVKPLYYAKTQKGFLFASEIKALLQEETVSRSVDPVAVAQHLTFLWCPAPRTMLSSVKKLEPGWAMLVRQGGISRAWRHYDLPQGDGHLQAGRLVTSPIQAAEMVREGVAQAVGRQMVADVPVGAFLSGGLDSSAVVNFARHHAGGRLQCFTIAFKGAGADEEGFVEDLPYARRVAKHLDVDLHTISVGPEMADHLQDMVYHLDEPQADPAPLNAMFICQLAREQGIKVLLSGAGGDDIFTGYRRHFALQQERYWAWLPAAVRQGMAGLAARLPVSTPLARRLRKAFEYAGLDGTERLVSYFYWQRLNTVMGLLAPEIRAELEQAAISAPLMTALENLPAGVSSLDRMLYLEGKYFLTDHNLNYTDKMSMAHGVEVRVPLLDPELVALVAQIPDNMKQRGRIGKWIFKKAMEPYLPHDVIYRPKSGFGVPLRRWMRHELRPLLGDLLSEESLRRRGLFDVAAVRRLIQQNDMGKIDAAYPLFSLLCIEIWCRQFVD